MFWNGTIYRHRNCWENSWTLYENPVHIESYPELDTPAQAPANTLFAGIPSTIGQQQKLSKEDASFDSVFGADFAEKASTRSAASVGLDCQSPKQQPDRFKCLSSMDVDDYNMLSLDSGQFDRSSSSRDTSLASLPESEDGSYDDAGEDSPGGKPGDATEDSPRGKPDETETSAGGKMAWSGNKHDGLFSGSRSRDALFQKPTSGKDSINLASSEDFESSPDSNDSGIHDNITYTPSYQPPLEHGVIHANITHPRSYQRSPLEDGGYLHGINRSHQITKTLDNKRVVNDIENNDNDDRCNDNIDNCATTTTTDYAEDIFSIPHLKSFSEYPSDSTFSHPPMNTLHESSRPLLETGGTGSDDQPWSRFTVRSLGWIRLTDGELNSDPGSRSALKKKIAKLSLGRNDFSDVVGRWGDGSSLCLELDEEGIALCDSQNLTVFTVQPIYAVCVWGVGRNHGRDFAYVARDSSTLQNVCHVFRCDGGQARDIANALECICEKLHERRACLKQRIETNAPDEWAWPKDNEWAWSDGLSETKATRPSDLPNLERIEMYPHHKQSSIPMDSYQDATISEHSRTLRCYYLGSEQVSNPKDAETLDDAMNKVYSRVSKDKWISVNVDIRPSTLIVTDSEFPDKILARCPVRYLSCMGISTSNMCLCSFIIHGPEDQLVAHIFHSRPYAGVLCKAIEKACKLQHQRSTDQVPNGKRWSTVLFPWIYPTTATSFAPQTL